MSELTLLIVKPDAVRRGLIGEILSRVERVGLKPIGMKFLLPTREQIDGFYPLTESWLRSAGTKMLRAYEELGRTPRDDLGTDDPVELGRIIRAWLVDYMTSGPILVVALKGNRAVEVLRKLVGPTLPYAAPPGTIRGDFSSDSPETATLERRVVMNLVHASDSRDEAIREIGYWFRKDELVEW